MYLAVLDTARDCHLCDASELLSSHVEIRCEVLKGWHDACRGVDVVQLPFHDGERRWTDVQGDMQSQMHYVSRALTAHTSSHDSP